MADDQPHQHCMRNGEIATIDTTLRLHVRASQDRHDELLRAIDRVGQRQDKTDEAVDRLEDRQSTLEGSTAEAQRDTAAKIAGLDAKIWRIALALAAGGGLGGGAVAGVNALLGSGG